VSASKVKAARKAARPEGEPYVHLKPTRRVLLPVPLVRDGQKMHPSGREIVRRFRRYGADEALKGAGVTKEKAKA
jgi:hypothetical protein